MTRIPTEELQYDVASIFISYFGRAAEFEAMSHYSKLYIGLLDDQGDDPAAHPTAFKQLAAQIYLDGTAHGEVPEEHTVSNAWYVNLVYQNVLGREADEEGLAYWVAELAAGSIQRAELVALIIDAAMRDERDGAYVQNRTEVAVEFGQWENSRPAIMDDLPFDAKEVLEGVDETPESAEAAHKKLASNLPETGDTFVLTNALDYATDNRAFHGGEESDFRFTNKAEMVLAAAGTLASDDVLKDSVQGDHDALSAYFAQAAQVTAASDVTLENIEHLEFNFINTDYAAFSFQNVKGAESLTLVGTANDGVLLSGTGKSGLSLIDASGLDGRIHMSPGTTVEHAMTVIGTSGDDTIVTGAGDDLIDAGDGNNNVKAGAGNNQITAGDGDDTIEVGHGNNLIGVGDGNNTIRAGNGNNVIVGGEDTNTVIVGHGDNSVDVGTGSITAGNGDNIISAVGALTATLGDGDNLLMLGDENDDITVGDGNNVLELGAGNNVVRGASSDGDNIVQAGDGNDEITLGDGDNDIEAGDGDNVIVLGDGDNVVVLGEGDDDVDVGDGDNQINLGDGDNDAELGGGDNTVIGGKGDDIITLAGDGSNLLMLGDGENEVKITGSGGDGDTVVYTGKDNDTIVLGDGINVIETGAGNDDITVGIGDNTITAGTGADTIVLRDSDPTDSGGTNLLVFALGDSGVVNDQIDTIENFHASTRDGSGNLIASGDKLDFGLAKGTEANTATGFTRDDFDDALIVANSQFASNSALRYVIVTDDDDASIKANWVYVNYDGDGLADLAIRIELTGGGELTFDDII